MSRIWLHRISHHMEVASPLLSRGYLTIGFSDFTETENFVEDVIRRGLPAIDKACAAYWPDHPQPRIRHNLKRFLCEMKQGDLVLVPKWENFDIYEITSEKPQPISELDAGNIQDWHQQPVLLREDGLLYRQNGSDIIDLGFFWRVKPVRVLLPRYEYADAALTARMKHRGTNIDISDLRRNIEDAITSFDTKSPINLHATLVDAIQATVLAALHEKLTPKKFELLVKWYMLKAGATSVDLPAGNISDKEGDADIVATFEPIKTIVYAQVKFHSGETSAWAIQQILAYRDSKVDRDTTDGYSQLSWVVSLSDTYSQEAINLAKEQKIQLINGQQFAAMLLQVGFAGISDEF